MLAPNRSAHTHVRRPSRAPARETVAHARPDRLRDQTRPSGGRLGGGSAGAGARARAALAGATGRAARGSRSPSGGARRRGGDGRSGLEHGPSRTANRSPSSIAIGVSSSTTIRVLSPGITISIPSGNATLPVTSVVRK